MTVRGRSIVMLGVACLLLFVCGFISVGWRAWEELSEYGALPERPDIAQAFALAADQGQSIVTLPDEGGAFLLVHPYVLTEDYLVSELAMDRVHAARMFHYNQAVENMHVYHIVGNRCVGHCTLDSRFDLCKSTPMVPAGQAVRLDWVDRSRPIVIRLIDAAAPSTDPLPTSAPSSR